MIRQAGINMDTEKCYELLLNFKFPPDWHSLRTGVSTSLDIFFYIFFKYQSKIFFNVEILHLVKCQNSLGIA